MRARWGVTLSFERLLDVNGYQVNIMGCNDAHADAFLWTDPEFTQHYEWLVSSNW